MIKEGYHLIRILEWVTGVDGIELFYDFNFTHDYRIYWKNIRHQFNCINCGVRTNGDGFIEGKYTKCVLGPMCERCFFLRVFIMSIMIEVKDEC